MAIVTIRAAKQTTDATSTALWNSPTGLTAGFTIFVFAHEAATSNQKIFAHHASRSNGDSSVIDVLLHADTGDAGAASWSVEVVESTGTLEVRITGVAATTIDWILRAEYYT